MSGGTRKNRMRNRHIHDKVGPQWGENKGKLN